MAQNPNARRRVYGRIQTEVDGRTGGIRVSTNPTNAFGNMYSNQVVHATSNRDLDRYAAMSGTMKDLLNLAANIYNKKSSYEDEQRRKEEAKAEEILNAQQAFEGATWAQGVLREAERKVLDGELKTVDDTAAYFQQATAGLHEADNAALINSARRYLEPGIQGILEKQRSKNLKEFHDYEVGRIGDNLGKAWDSFNWADEVGNQELQERLSQGRSLYEKLPGVDPAVYDDIVFNSGASAAKRSIRSDPVRAMEIIGKLEGLPGQYEKAQTLREDLERESLKWDKEEETLAAVEEKKAQDGHFTAALGTLIKAQTPEGLAEAKSQLFSNSDDLVQLMGADNAFNLQQLINRQESLFMQEDGRERQQRLQASAEKRMDLMIRVQSGDYVSNREINDAELEAEDYFKMIDYRDQSEVGDEKLRRGIQAAAWESFQTRINSGSAQFHVTRDAEGSPSFSQSEQRFYNGKILEAVRSVRRNEFEEGDVGEAHYINALIAAGDEATANILNFKEGYRWRNPQEIQGDSPRATAITPETIKNIPVSELQQPENMEALKQALRGSTPITPLYTESGFPIKRSINMQLILNSSPEQRSLISDVILQEAIENRASETVKRQEQAWQDQQSFQQMTRGARERRQAREEQVTGTLGTVAKIPYQLGQAAMEIPNSFFRQFNRDMAQRSSSQTNENE